MAKRIYSGIGKFKRVEAELREATNGFRTALHYIEEALGGPRTEAELALLRSVRDQTRKVHEQARTIVGRLIQETEGLKER